MTIIKSYFIENQHLSDETKITNLQELNTSVDTQLVYSVFKTLVDKKVVYCCWSSGYIKNNKVYLTKIGNTALEALCLLPFTNKETLVFQEILGKKPVKTKVRQALKKAAPNSSICFVGDFDKTLDGEMVPSLNIVGTIKIEQTDTIS